jgi:hypothetical protein
MKTRLLKLTAAMSLIAAHVSLNVKAQTVSTFENLSLSTNTYWEGSTTTTDTAFTSGNAIFPNTYNFYWSAGWAYSNMQDSITSGYVNEYSSRPAIGYNKSANYGVGWGGSKVILKGNALHGVVSGFYITNGTYATLSMEQGDLFAKKFGGASGNDPDWFKLTVRKWLGGAMPKDSVEFYLADFRSANNVKDYIVKTWQWLDLSGLGNVDSLQFDLSSSDVGSFGMNTPAFFCMDDFTTADIALSAKNINTGINLVSIYPNPVNDIVNIDIAGLTSKNLQVSITDITGKLLDAKKINTVEKISFDISAYNKGVYFINITGDNVFINRKLIKE